MSLQKTRKLTYDWEPYFSYDKIDEGVVSFYSADRPESATNDAGSIFYKKTLWDIFVYAMAIGKSKELRKPVVKPSRTIPVDAIKEHHIVSMLGVAFSDESVGLEILQNPKDLRIICEEYANGGIDFLIEMKKLRDYDNPLSELEKEFFKLLENKS
jgi:hypothetical protein|tara:strand:- start:217 stop:684 length:468 start_codon:yes stop_codon:yes gene_type:complete